MSPLALQSWSSASKKLVSADKDIRVASITCSMAMMMRMVMRCGDSDVDFDDGNDANSDASDHEDDDGDNGVGDVMW